MKFLIVDEDTNRNRAIRSILANLGYKSNDVESVSDLKSAIGTLKKKKFDCAFISQDQNKIGGLELIKEIRNSPSLKGLPVVLVHNEVSRENVIAAGQAGASAFIGYPCSVNDVEDALKQAMKRVG